VEGPGFQDPLLSVIGENDMTANITVPGYLYQVLKGITYIENYIETNSDTIDMVNRVMLRNTLRQMREFVDISLKELRHDKS